MAQTNSSLASDKFCEFSAVLRGLGPTMFSDHNGGGRGEHFPRLAAPDFVSLFQNPKYQNMLREVRILHFSKHWFSVLRLLQWGLH